MVTEAERPLVFTDRAITGDLPVPRRTAPGRGPARGHPGCGVGGGAAGVLSGEGTAEARILRVDGGVTVARRDQGSTHGVRGTDGMLLSLIAFVLGLTVLVWTATGLGGLFTHGGWPAGVDFTHTPSVMRALVTKLHDLAGAWSDTPPDELSGYGLFWGLLISQLMGLDCARGSSSA